MARVNCLLTSNACNFLLYTRNEGTIQRWSDGKETTLSSEKESIWAQWHSRCTISITSGVSSIASCCIAPMILILSFEKTKSNARWSTYLQQHQFKPFGYHSRQTTTILFMKTPDQCFEYNSYWECALFTVNSRNHSQFYGNNFELFTFAIPLIFKHIHRNACEQWKTSRRAHRFQ